MITTVEPGDPDPVGRCSPLGRGHCHHGCQLLARGAGCWHPLED
jgi:hypothetical protein